MVKQSIDIYVLCWNEMQIAPFIVDYWKKVARHVYVFDNGSTDGSIEYLSSFDWITVEHYESDGINDLIYLKIKNNCWKGSDADWVWVSDFDEILYSDNFQEELDFLDENGYTIVKPNWINCVSKTNVPEYQEGKLLHELIDGGVYGGPKNIFFKPSEIKEINYGPGAHFCQPTGNVKLANKLNVIHFTNLGVEYILNRNHLYRDRLSKVNKSMGFGIHYMYTDDKYVSDMENDYKNRKPIKDLLK